MSVNKLKQLNMTVYHLENIVWSLPEDMSQDELDALNETLPQGMDRPFCTKAEAENAADILSDEYGFLVESFDIVPVYYAAPDAQ